jgi:hypothetical protein
MSITVYWACLEDEWIKASEPEKISKRFYNLGIRNDNKDSFSSINYCPVFNESLKNIYAIKSIYDYSFKIKENDCVSLNYDQKFFNDHVIIRSIEKKFFSFSVKYVFFVEEDSLNMSAYQYPVFEENEITKRCMTLPGSFDIGRYFRNLEFPFILKKDFDEFIVNEEDVLYYLQFHTKEKINFKQFKVNEELKNMMDSVRLINKYSKDKFYDIIVIYLPIRGVY